MESQFCPELVVRSLNFHGQPLQKLWEADLAKYDLSFSKEPDFEVYQQRQKHLGFQDRGKRQKLLQFIVNKATALFDPAVLELEARERSSGDEGCYAVVPTYESFLDIDKQNKNRHIFEIVKPGDLVIGSILNKSVSGLLLKVLCIDGEFPRGVADLGIKAFCPMGNIIPAADKKNVNRTYLMNDTVCCEVLEVIPDTDKLVCGMKGTMLPPGSEYASRLGLIHSEDFPQAYNMHKAKKSIES